jgi:hypothetical protein
VAHTVVQNGVLQRIRYRALSHHVVKRLWPVFARDYLIRHLIADFRLSIAD